MKRMSAALLICLTLFVAVQAARAFDPEYETRIQVMADLGNTLNTDTPPVMGGLGYYLSPDWIVGGYVSYARMEWGSYWGAGPVWELGGYTEYEFDRGGAFTPYVGLQFGLLDGDEKDDTVTELTLAAGAKVFITQTIAFFVEADAGFAGEDIYDFERSMTTVDIVEGTGDGQGFTAAAGLRFLL